MAKKKPEIKSTRIPFVVSEAQAVAFDEAIEKANPQLKAAGLRSQILRMLMQRYVEEQKIRWPEE